MVTPSKIKADKRTDQFLKQVGLRIREIRDSKGLTLEQVEAAGILAGGTYKKLNLGIL